MEVKNPNTSRRIVYSFDYRYEASMTLEYMQDIIDRYGFVTVCDFYDIVGDKHDDYYDEDLISFGWTNINGSIIVQNKNGIGYTLILPLAIKAKNSVGVSSNADNVSHPQHYQSKTGLEVIDVVEAFTSDLCGIEATDTGNIIKYICRWKHKNGLEDLKKAQWYLSHLIKHIEKETDNK